MVAAPHRADNKPIRLGRGVGSKTRAFLATAPPNCFAQDSSNGKPGCWVFTISTKSERVASEDRIPGPYARIGRAPKSCAGIGHRWNCRLGPPGAGRAKAVLLDVGIIVMQWERHDFAAKRRPSSRPQPPQLASTRLRPSRGRSGRHRQRCRLARSIACMRISGLQPRCAERMPERTRQRGTNTTRGG